MGENRQPSDAMHTRFSCCKRYQKLNGVDGDGTSEEGDNEHQPNVDDLNQHAQMNGNSEWNDIEISRLYGIISKRL